ncbi:neurogenic differentiation factor 2-like [Palaemon carinicauda]|uniref:neurogenic differentiation factor 2-like n=1 Tax=Palaemon carinicauda TaxID=392227 RepID=UPI0035B65E97
MIVRKENPLRLQYTDIMDHQYSDDNNNTPEEKRSHSKTPEKYGLRPRSVNKRFHLERTRGRSSKVEPSKAGKARPPPLSKYRRKTANARERHRMREINDAFESLRKTLPHFCTRRATSTMTKITTLKLAVNYIRTLSHILEDGHPGDLSFIDSFQVDISFGGAQFLRPVVSEVKELQCQTGRGLEAIQCQTGRGLKAFQRQTGRGLEAFQCQADRGLEAFQCQTSRGLEAIQLQTGRGLKAFQCQTDRGLEASLGSTDPSCSVSTLSSTSSSPTAGELSDLMSEGTSGFEDTLDAFDDIPALQEVDSFALFLASDGDMLPLES